MCLNRTCAHSGIYHARKLSADSPPTSKDQRLHGRIVALRSAGNTAVSSPLWTANPKKIRKCRGHFSFKMSLFFMPSKKICGLKLVQISIYSNVFGIWLCFYIHIEVKCSCCHLNPRPFNSRLFNHELFNPVLHHEFLNQGVERFVVEKSYVEKSRVEMSSP